MGNDISYIFNSNLENLKEEELEEFALNKQIFDAKILSVHTPLLVTAAIKVFNKPQKFKLKLFGVESDRFTHDIHNFTDKEQECIKELKELNSKIVKVQLVSIQLNGEVNTILFTENVHSFTFKNSFNQYLVDSELLTLTSLFAYDQ